MAQSSTRATTTHSRKRRANRRRTHLTMRDNTTGLRIRYLRTSQGLTLAVVAGAIGVSPSLLSRIENGQRPPSPDLLDRLSAYFGVSFEPPAPAFLTDDAVLAEDSREVLRGSASVAAALSPRTTRMVDLASIALNTALCELRPQLKNHHHSVRYNTCKTLAALASGPLEALVSISREDQDPAVRNAACQILTLLFDTYCSDST